MVATVKVGQFRGFFERKKSVILSFRSIKSLICTKNFSNENVNKRYIE